MSYEAVRDRPSRSKKRVQSGNQEAEDLIAALKELTAVLETDFAQTEGAFTQVAQWLELRHDH